MNLAHRSTLPEVMDDADIPADIYARCQRELAVINRITLTHRPTLRWLDRSTAHLPPGSNLSILDVACGHGDLLRAIHLWALRRGLAATLTGIDLNPSSAVFAAAATPADMQIAYVTGDVFAYTPAPDYIVTSQFTHHLTDADLVRFLQWLDAHASAGWFIADLHRHALAYYGFPILARIGRWHPIVRTDGTISIARSFRRADWARALAAAGINARISWHIPFRFCVDCTKSERPD